MEGSREGSRGAARLLGGGEAVLHVRRVEESSEHGALRLAPAVSRAVLRAVPRALAVR